MDKVLINDFYYSYSLKTLFAPLELFSLCYFHIKISQMFYSINLKKLDIASEYSAKYFIQMYFGEVKKKNLMIMI